MTKGTIYLCYCCFVFLLLTQQACIDRDEFDFSKMSDNYSVDAGIALPIASADVTIADFFQERQDTVIYDKDRDSLIRIVYRNDSLYTLQLKDYYTSPFDEIIHEKYNPGDIKINEDSIVAEISLGELMDQMDHAATAYSVFERMTSNGLPVLIPETELIEAGVHAYNSPQNFTSVTFAEGEVSMTVSNELPVPVKMIVGVFDVNRDVVVGELTYERLNPNETQVQTFDLAGKSLSNNLQAKVIGFKTWGSGTQKVELNKSDKIIVLAELKDVKIMEGTAIVPEQIFEDSLSISFDTDGEYIEYVKTRNGQLRVSIISGLVAQFDIQLTFPATIRDGQALEEIIIPVYDVQNNSFIIDFSNTYTDLTTGEFPYNSMPIKYKIHLPGDQEITYRPAEGVNTYFDLTDVEIFSIEGYFGQKALALAPDTIDLGISVFENIQSGLVFTEPEINITLQNSAGIPAVISMDIISLNNSGDAEPLGYLFSNMLAPQNIGDSRTTAYAINKSNSNIVDFLALPPKLISLSGEIKCNPDSSTQKNFLTIDSKAVFGIEMDLPLILRSNEISFTDTITYNYFEQLEKISRASLIMEYVNEFPLDVNLELFVSDSVSHTHVDTISTYNTVLLDASTVDANGNLKRGSEGTSIFELNEMAIHNILEGNIMIISGKMNTAGNKRVELHANHTLHLEFKINGQYNTQN